MYKVETIGDAYMVASGLPTVYDCHAQEMCLLALELQDSVKHHVIEHLPHQKLQLRIGLHTGVSVIPLLYTAPYIQVWKYSKLTSTYIHTYNTYIRKFITRNIVKHVARIRGAGSR